MSLQAGSPMIWPSLAAVCLAMVLVERGWRMGRPLSLAGWALAIGALADLAGKAGAWGLAVGVVTGIAAALALVLLAGARTPPGPMRSERNPRHVQPAPERRNLSKRLVVFVLVVPVSFAAAQLCAFGIEALARAGGASPADRLVLLLALQPILWSVLMTWQMTRSDPAKMWSGPALLAALGTAAWRLA